MICPDCKGAKQVTAHINYGDRRPHEWKQIDCPTCDGYGEISAHHAERKRIGRLLAQARMAREESLFECAKRAGVTSAELSGIEHGKPRYDGFLQMHPYWPKAIDTAMQEKTK